MSGAVYAGATPQYWLPAAVALRHDLGWDPVWWLATEPRQDAGAYRARVRAAFPDVVWHDMGAAMRGRFPRVVDRWPPFEPGADLLGRLAGHEVVALRMMDRQDPDGRTFGYGARRRHWLRLVRGWSTVLDHLDPEVVVFPVAPHLVADYVLYACAADRGVRTVVVDSDWRRSRALVADDLGGGTPALWAGAPAPGVAPDLAPATAAALARLRGEYADAAPAIDQVTRAKAPRPSPPRRAAAVAARTLRRTVASARVGRDPDAPLASGARQWLAARGRPIEAAPPSSVEMLVHRWRGNRRSRALAERWDRLVTVRTPPAGPYVYLPLHFQPERTTCPSGGPFVDQELAVRLVAAALPDGWRVVVREHPGSFLRNGTGHRGRVGPLYDDLAAVPGVELAPASGDPLPWLDGAAAVATVTGTSAWEAVVRGIPALSFGAPWYRGVPGVRQVGDAAGVAAALAAVGDGVDGDAVQRWVALLDAVSVEAHPNPRAFAASGWSLEDNGRALARAVVAHVRGEDRR